MIYLSASKHPRLAIEIKLGNNWKVVDCLLDTGFSSGIFSKSDDALLGIEFLDGFCFLLDLKNNKVSLG